jgi:hypothetical protein
MNTPVNAQVIADAGLLLDYLAAKGLDQAVQVNPRQAHMGGLIVDSALQHRQRYASMVAPRVATLITAWPDADTTSGFHTRLDTPEDDASLEEAAPGTAAADQAGLRRLGAVINWYSPGRLVQAAQTAEAFLDHGIDTTADLRAQLEDETTREPLRRVLQKIPSIGPRALDYLEILCGLTPASTIGSRLRLATHRAGITEKDAEHLRQVRAHAAELGDWPLGDLDAVLWASHPS